MQLELLLQVQEDLQNAMHNPMGSGVPAVKENVLALVRELAEVLDELPSKPWDKKEKEIDREALTNELADVLMFYLNILLALDVEVDELSKAFFRKINKARERYVNV